MTANSKTALTTPEGDVIELTEDMVELALEASRTSPRKRIILPLHKSDDSNLHRMFNAIQPGSYIRPHRHHAHPKDESFVVLRGKVGVLVFDENGTALSQHTIQAGASVFGIDLAAGTWHTILALAPDTVIYEVKPGPYSPADDKDFADWAPAENTEAARTLVNLWESMFQDNPTS